MTEKAGGVRIGSRRVVLAGVGINIVVARGTAGIRRDRFVGESLPMTLYTIANVLGKLDRGKILYTLIAADDKIRCPASTLGSSAPRWILWISTLKSRLLPVSGSMVCEVWQSTQYFTSRRFPP